MRLPAIAIASLSIVALPAGRGLGAALKGLTMLAEVKILRRLLALAAICSLFASGSVAAAPPADALLAGLQMDEVIYFQYAVYYLPKPPDDPRAVLRRHLAGVGRGLKVVDVLPKAPSDAHLRVTLEKDVQKNYKPMDMASLQYFGRGLSKTQGQLLQASEQALILDFVHPKKKVWDALGTANRLLEQLARETGGLIWDDETREIFTPDDWHTRRVASMGTGVPDVTRQTIIHAYKSTDLVRAITLGMAKFGLPDVVISDFPWSMNVQMGHIINLFCQAMAEGAAFVKPDEFDLDLRSIRHPGVRETQSKSLKANATAVARLSLKKGTPEDGDPHNRLIEITAARYPGPDVHAKQEMMASSFFGWEDSVVRVRHNAALQAASRKAKLRLPALRASFSAGLRPGEFIQVKAPFSTPGGGTEWMWVEVMKWNGEAIEGMLKNEPVDIPSLHGGQVVTVKESEIFDYMRTFPDGAQEGNETGNILREMQKQQQ